MPALAGDGALPVLGHDPIPHVATVPVHSEALALWSRDKISSATIVHIDTHDDIRTIPGERLATLRSLRGNVPRIAQAGSAGKARLYNLGNFLSAGAALGVVREVYWVQPFAYLSEKDPQKALSGYLRDAGFSEGEVASFSLADGMFSGLTDGVPLHLCTPRSLPANLGPVVLSLDLDFIPMAAAVHRIDELEVVESLFRELSRKQLTVLGAVIAESVDYEFLKPWLLWLGELVGQRLGNPGFGPEHPGYARYQRLQRLQTSLTRNNFEGIDAGAFLGGDNADLGQAAYRSLDRVLRGELDGALSLSLDMCRRDGRYCMLMSEFGLILLERGDFANADRFFAPAFEINRTSNYGLEGFALSNVIRRRFPEAIAIYKRLAETKDTFPNLFIIGYLYGKLGDAANEGAYYTKAAEALPGDDPLIALQRDTEKEALAAAVDYLERHGNLAGARKIKATPSYRRWKGLER